jgi:Protein of unknown function (DUF1579)
MSILDALSACAGSWHGKSTLQDPYNDIAEESQSGLTVTPVLGGRFVRMDYTWSYKEKPQEGSLLMGFDKGADKVTAHWIDSWHNSDKVMACTGPRPVGKAYSVRGSYAAPPGPDWGWRIDLTPEDGGTLRLVMFNVWPESEGGKEELAVEAVYART